MLETISVRTEGVMNERKDCAMTHDPNSFSESTDVRADIVDRAIDSLKQDELYSEAQLKAIQTILHESATPDEAALTEILQED